MSIVKFELNLIVDPSIFSFHHRIFYICGYPALSLESGDLVSIGFIGSFSGLSHSLMIYETDLQLIFMSLDLNLRCFFFPTQMYVAHASKSKDKERL